MSRKSTRSAPRSAAAAPPAEDALAALFRRNLRSVVALAVRVVAVGLLLALLERELPWVRRNRLFVEALGSVLVVWPFFTAVGRNAAWRIALGRAYVQEKRWAEAERALLPFSRRGYQPFDAGGEGAYWFAVTLRAIGRAEESRHLFRSIAQTRRGPWREKAEAELAASA